MFARERANSSRAIGEVPGALCRQPWTRERAAFWRRANEKIPLSARLSFLDYFVMLFKNWFFSTNLLTNTKNGKEFFMKRKSVWKKGETPYCEVESVVMPKEPGGSIIFNLTPRGARESERRDRLFRIEQAKIKRFNNSNSAGILWYDCLFGSWGS